MNKNTLPFLLNLSSLPSPCSALQPSDLKPDCSLTIPPASFLLERQNRSWPRRIPGGIGGGAVPVSRESVMTQRCFGRPASRQKPSSSAYPENEPQV